MREVEIPGGKAWFKEPKVDEIPGKTVKLIRAAVMSATTQLQEYPEIFTEPQKVTDSDGTERDETMEEMNVRLAPKLAGMKLSMEQAFAFDNMREAAAAGLLDHWTLERPLPTFDTIGDLPSDLYEALLEGVGGMSAAELVENFEPTGAREDDGSPTGGSGS